MLIKFNDYWLAHICHDLCNYISAASQKRDVERALTRFIAKTGKIHNLFNSEDSNLFPLISCVKEEEEYKLPTYVDALIFKDQVFEEEEVERRPKRRRHNQRPDENDDDDDDMSRLNDSIAESEVIDNPFLRPVRMPRNNKKSWFPERKQPYAVNQSIIISLLISQYFNCTHVLYRYLCLTIPMQYIQYLLYNIFSI